MRAQDLVVSGGLVYSLQRHIDLDGAHHGPLAWRILASICQTAADWQGTGHAARTALEARIRLWDDIAKTLPR